jgi:hypothetical protein
MLKLSVDAINEILVSEMMGWRFVNASKKAQAQLDALSDRLIRFFLLINRQGIPSTKMVSEIVLREILGWNRAATELERKAELDATSERIITYFTEFAPAHHGPLPGLPGGTGLA